MFTWVGLSYRELLHVTWKGGNPRMYLINKVVVFAPNKTEARQVGVGENYAQPEVHRA